MKKLILALALVGLMASGARADLILSTSNLPGTPLNMTAGTTSGPMLVNVVSDNPPQDVMAAWNFSLEISADAGATGTLTVQSPTTGTPPNPLNYIFGDHGLGIAVTNGGTSLSANDFLDPNFGLGVPVPGTPGANLLQIDYLASPDASGLFGVYAVQGAPFTQWTDSSLTTQFFSNVPDGTGTVRIGEVLVTPSVGPQPIPEPSSLVLFGLSVAPLAAWCLRRRGPLATNPSGSAP